MSRPHTIRSIVAATIAAVLVVALPLLPANAATTVLAPGEGTLSGALTGATGDHDFELMFLPITGTGAEDYRDVTTNGSNQFSLNIAAGSYHVKVQSIDGLSTAAWFGGQTIREQDADRVVVTAGATTPVAWSLGTAPGSIFGTISGPPSDHNFLVSAYSTEAGVDERWDLGFDVFAANEGWEIDGLPTTGFFRLVFQDLDDFPQTYDTNAEVVVPAQVGGLDYGNVAMSSGGFSIDRIAGADRYDTAVKVAKTQYPTATNLVVVVSGENYPDALSAGPAAAGMHAPLVLVRKNSIPQVVRDQLEVWDPDVIFVVGGTGVISTTIENQLLGYADFVDRVAGADRYATSRAVLDQMTSSVDTIYLANGTNFPDALAAGPAAASRNGAVLLVRGSSAHLDAATKAIIDAKPVTFPVQIAGGTGSVSKGIDDDLFALTHDHRRRAGPDRYSTGAAVTYGSFSHADTVYLATGANFPDALAAGAVAGSQHAPILLVRKECIPDDVMQQLYFIQPNQIFVLGGPTVVSDAVLDFTGCSDL